MEQVRATRAELLAKTRQIKLAHQSRDLLQEKRTALLKEMMRTAEQVVAGGDELERSAGESALALSMAEAIDGPEAVRSAAFAAAGQVMLQVTGANVMGVALPVIEQKSVMRGPLGRGYSLPTVTARVDAVAEAFEAQIDLIIALAISEVRLKRLAEEIARASRRVNALDNILIPRLEEQRAYVEMVLEERAREDTFRLKRVKMKLQRQRL